MATFFLIIIYLTFISLGLPDSLLGSAWPVIQSSLSVPLHYGGIISMIITGGTIISSLCSAKLIYRFGTPIVTFISVFMTAVALFGFGISPSFLWLCVFAIPLGLGAGAVDSGLNNYVALHYKANHMSWLHCFWGIGATTGPMIMSLFIAQNIWQKGYFTISVIQFSLVLILLFVVYSWKKFENKLKTQKEENISSQKNHLFQVPYVKVALLSFFCYSAAEASAGLWGSSFLIYHKGFSPDFAAKAISMFYIGITTGRFLSGFISLKWESNYLIRLGQIVCMIGIVVLLLPTIKVVSIKVVSIIGLFLIGLGYAPIFPCMLHETPHRFGKEISQFIMGLQMAFAYMGSTFMPPILGLVFSKWGIQSFPLFLLFFVIIMMMGTEHICAYMKKRQEVQC